jgi:hypothetical protein
MFLYTRESARDDEQEQSDTERGKGTNLEYERWTELSR